MKGVSATAKMMESNSNGHHVDSNKMAADRHVEKMDHEKYQHPVVRAKPKELDGYVGFANLPNQVYRKAVKRGFDFTLMVVGESLLLLRLLRRFHSKPWEPDLASFT